MSETLFRGKDVKTGNWVYGSLVDWYGDGNHMLIFEPRRHPSTLPMGMIFKDSVHAVIPQTVGQSTGCYDKRGRIIFEGDIVDCWDNGLNARGVVKHREDGMWIINPSWQHHLIWGLRPNNKGQTDVEVVGIIHEECAL